MKPKHQEKFLNGLISANAHFDYRDVNGKCAIHYAVASENREAVKLLCGNGSSLHEWDDKSIPAQFYAIENDITVNFFQFILEFGKDLRMTDVSLNNALHYVVKKGLANHLGVLLKYMNNNLNYNEIINILSAKNVSGNTPIHLCILHNQKTCLLMLSRLKISHSIQNESGDTALDLATRTCNADAIRILKDLSNEKKYYEISDFRSKTLTYRQSVQHCLNYANTLRRGKTTIGKVFNSYPPIFKCVKEYKSNGGDNFQLNEGECVVIYLVLQSKVAYGYKVLSSDRNFAWFPSSVIGMNSTKQILEFQKEHATLANLTIHIPELPIKSQSSPIPMLLFLNLSMSEKKLGIEVGSRKFKITSPNDQVLDYASKLYIRNVEIDSPADICGLRVGDQILYIMSNEVTTMNQKTVKSILKKMLESKPPPSQFPGSVIRQISLLILRENEEQENIFTIDGRADLISEQPTLNSTSPNESLASHRFDLHPKFFNQSFVTIQQNLSIKQFINNKYQKPLPPLPKIAERSVSTEQFLKADQNDTDSSISLDKLPPPPPELL